MKKVPENIEHEEVILSGMLAEFRIALLQEIDSANRSASSSAVPLINGKRIAQVGSSYQYIFDIESALNLPGDAPGDLYVPGHSLLEVVVISIDGMAITLSIPENLGAFVPSARLRSDLVFLMRKLIDRIESKADISNPVGDRILGAPVGGQPVQIEISYLNREQNQALGSSLGHNTTFIGGPPGTGKTQTIGGIGEQLYRRGRSVLLVSHTNIAVDQALMRIGECLDESELEKGLVLRVGDPKDLKLNDMLNLLLKTHVDRRSAELAERRTNLESSLNTATAQIREICKTIDICEWVDEAQDDITSMTTDLYDLQKLEMNLERIRSELSQLQASSDYWNTAQQAAHDANSHLIKISRLDELISKLKRWIESSQVKLKEVANNLSNAESLLLEVSSVGWLTRKWRGLPSPEEQLQVVQNLHKEFGRVGLELDEINRKFESAQKTRFFLYTKVQAFRSRYSADPPQVFHQVNAHATKIKQLKQQIRNIADQCGSTHLELKELFEARLLVLKQLGFTQECSGSLESMLSNIKFAFRQAVDKIEGVDLQQLRLERDRLNAQIRAIEAELAQIEDALKKVEQLVIADAMVVATTLTRAYLRDSIQLRRFDTVILDEASMAPIPALWVAASLADYNAVVVGDHKQLPPIVLSPHELAEKWLGKDIFEVAGFSNSRSTPSHLINLTRQYRMHPDISAISNNLIYDGRLKDAKSTTNDEGLFEWYQKDWGHDSPVLLVDTGSLNAWVTSVPRGRGSSRLNFLSATVCVDLAEQLLLNGRPKFQIRDDSRILIACPYRPHARLLELLLREQRLDGEIRAGTAHSFQGSEADIVIFDMVNDEPHWRVAMFIPQFDEGTKRLLNVALTRARRRLIIVGDFEYIVKHSKKSFVGSQLIPFLCENYHSVDALDVVKAGLAARAAKAQSLTVGGNVEPDNSRLVMTQEHFYTFLRADLAKAKSRIVIYSPFLTQNRLAQLKPQICAALERGTRVYVVTKALCERGKRELSQYRMLERALTKWGVIVAHKQGMHEKLIFIDRAILWEGSLNPLSFSNTGEHMERRVSQKVFEDYARTLHLNDLIGEYDDGLPICPICGSEVMAREGSDAPFFWRCVEKDCYTRSIDQPPLKDGIIRCANCGGKVECGEWGGKPAWRCIENRHHHQKVARTHLRLPKMRTIVSKSKLRELDKHFGISSPKSIPHAPSVQQDPFLFEPD